MSEEVEIASKKLWDLFYSTIDSNGKYREIDKEVFIAAMVSTLKQYYSEGFEAAERSLDSMRAALVEKDKAFKSITQWGFTADQRKFEGNHKKVIKMIVQIAQEALTPEAAGKAQEKDGGV